jgi:Glutaredoxin-like domain (DUF836)
MEVTAAETQGGDAARIILIGRPGCHLCDDARAVVRRVAGDLAVGWEERSIDDDPSLRERYAEEIPVVLVDSKQHAFWRVDEQRLREALTSSTGSAERGWLRRLRGRGGAEVQDHRGGGG